MQASFRLAPKALAVDFKFLPHVVHDSFPFFESFSLNYAIRFELFIHSTLLCEVCVCECVCVRLAVCVCCLPKVQNAVSGF